MPGDTASPCPSSLADELDAMLTAGIHPQRLGQWVAINQCALIAALRLVPTAVSISEKPLEQDVPTLR